MEQISKLNYYEILDLQPEAASPEKIKIQYQDLKSFYSNLNIEKGAFSESERQGLQELLEEAYAVLGNQTLKKIYDEKMGYIIPSFKKGSEEIKDLEPSQELILKSLDNSNLSDKNVKSNDILLKSQKKQTDLHFSESSAKNINDNPFEKSAAPPSRDNRNFWKLSYEMDFQKEAQFQSCEVWEGSLLKEVREYKNVTIQKLSCYTKINAFYIAAVENMDSRYLPAPVFVRGYVVQIARALGLDEEKVAQSYMNQYRQACEHNKEISL